VKSHAVRILKSKKLSLLIKLVLVVGVFTLLMDKGLISLEATGRALQNWPLLLAAFGVMFLNLLLSMVRWQILLKAQGIHFKLLRTIELGWVGHFFNTALPGAVSGDFIKAFYVGKEVQGKKSTAFGSILFDRILGLSALVLVSAIALSLDFSHFVGSPILAAIQVVLLSSGFAVLAFYGYLFVVQEHRDPFILVLKWVEKRVPRARSVTQLYLAIRVYHSQRSSVVKALLISLVMHMNMGWVAVLLATALGDAALPLLTLFVVVPLGMLATAIPVLPGGLGTGHAAYTWGFLLLGSQRGADVFNLQFLLGLILSGMGGLIYLRFRSQENGPILSPYVGDELHSRTS